MLIPNHLTVKIRFIGYETGADSQCERSDRVPISFPPQPLQQRCAEQPIANPCVGEGRQRECFGAAPQPAALSWLPQGIGRDTRSACFCPFDPTKVWAHSAQRRHAAMHTRRYGDTHTHVGPLRSCAGAPREGPYSPTPRGRCKPPPPYGTAVGIPHTRGRKGLSCTGPCKELHSNREQCGLTSRAGQDGISVQGKKLRQYRHAAAKRTRAPRAGTGGG